MNYHGQWRVEEEEWSKTNKKNPKQTKKTTPKSKQQLEWAYAGIWEADLCYWSSHFYNTWSNTDKQSIFRDSRTRIDADEPEWCLSILKQLFWYIVLKVQNSYWQCAFSSNWFSRKIFLSSPCRNSDWIKWISVHRSSGPL